MLIHQVCKATGLTKKAVEYYEGQGLIRPRIGENVYRQYTGEDAKTLRKIALLKKWGCVRRISTGFSKVITTRHKNWPVAA